MKKRLLTVLLAVCLVLALGTVSAMADDPVATVNGTKHYTLNDVLTAAQEAGTADIVLFADIEGTIDGNISIPEDMTVTLDLNGHALIGHNSGSWIENHGNLTINDSSADADSHGIGTGKIYTTNIDAQGRHAVENYGTLTINSGIFGDSDVYQENGNGVQRGNAVRNYGVATINGGAFTACDNYTNGGYAYAIANGDEYYPDAIMTINYATLYGNCNGLLASDGGTLVANDGSYTLGTGKVKSCYRIAYVSGNNGSVIIEGGVYTRNVPNNYGFFGGSSSADGIVVNNGTFEDKRDGNGIHVDSGEATITGGQFKDALSKGTSATISVTGGTFKNDVTEYIPDGSTLIQNTDGEVIVDESKTAIARVDGIGFTDLAKAIAAADDGDTVTLVNDVDDTINLVITDKNLTIEGNGQSITTEVGGGATSIGVQLVRSSLTLNNVDWRFTPNTNGGTAIDVQNNGSELTLNNSTVTINGTKRGMVMSATADSDENLAKINILNGSVLNVSNLSGNGSNGGAWTVTDSTINMNGIGNHALSVDTLTVTDSRLIFDDIGYAALYGENIVLNDGADVQINNAGNALPFQSTWDPTITYNYPVELKNADSSMEIKTGAQIAITNCENLNNEVNNTIYIPEGGDFTSNGTVTATVELGDANMNLVTVINRDSTTMLLVADGGTYKLDNPGNYNGYEFRGWRDNSGELHKAGETVTVNSDMTFTAVWSAINIPDTYDIEIADAANGEVDTSLSNASAGSTITITATPDSGYSVASVTVTGPDGRVDVVRVNATTYTFKMPAGDVTVRVTFTDSDALPFTDVSAGQWFYDAVAYVYTNGMMEGDSATTFNPDGTMTRAMFWAVLGRIDGATITGTNWADQARDWAMAEGVSDGTDPNGLVTREQMVTMLWRYAVAKGYDVSIGESTNILSYADFGQISEYAIPAMQWGCGSGVITGMTDTTLVPQGTATRAQCAAIFMRFDQM